MGILPYAGRVQHQFCVVNTKHTKIPSFFGIPATVRNVIKKRCHCRPDVPEGVSGGFLSFGDNAMAQMLPFETTIAIKAMPDDYNGSWVIDGPVGSDEKDYDGETMEPHGVWKGMDMFDLLGRHVDYEHQYRKSLNPRFLIGVGVDRRLEKGVCHLRAELYKDKELAKSLWEHLNTKTAAGENGYAGYSIEGRVLERDPKDRNIIKNVEVHRVTVSMSPKGFGKTRVLPVQSVIKAALDEDGVKSIAPESWVGEDAWDAFHAVLTSEEIPLPRYSQIGTIIKAYMTGSEIVAPGAGDIAPLRQQSLIGPPVVQKASEATKKPSRPTARQTKPTSSKPRPTTSTVRKADETEKAVACWGDWLASRGMDTRLARVIHKKLEKTYA